RSAPEALYLTFDSLSLRQARQRLQRAVAMRQGQGALATSVDEQVSDRAAQLSHVALPLEMLQRIHQIRLDDRWYVRRVTESRSHLRHHAGRQPPDVLPSLPQRGNLQPEHAKAVEEVRQHATVLI